MRGFVTCSACGRDIKPNLALVVLEVPYRHRFRCQDIHSCFQAMDRSMK